MTVSGVWPTGQLTSAPWADGDFLDRLTARADTSPFSADFAITFDDVVLDWIGFRACINDDAVRFDVSGCGGVAVLTCIHSPSADWRVSRRDGLFLMGLI
jgi:hypothetical protein